MLLVDGEERDWQPILQELVTAGFTVHSRRVVDDDDLRAAVAAGPCDLVFAEHVSPALGVEEALEILYTGAGVDAPLIIVAGKIGERAVAAALRAGASDYVSTDRLQELGAVVRGSLAKRAARRQQDADVAELERAAGVLRQAELAARQAEAHMRRLLDGAPDAIIVADRSGVIQAVDDQTERLLGYARDELLDRSIELLVPNAARGAHVAARFAADPGIRPMGVERDLY
ncbi:MAG: PAS domain S-box protein, partial [Solirubrobacteraceae bacterium]